jgi:hypothetical protein
LRKKRKRRGSIRTDDKQVEKRIVLHLVPHHVPHLVPHKAHRSSQEEAAAEEKKSGGSKRTGEKNREEMGSVKMRVLISG